MLPTKQKQLLDFIDLYISQKSIAPSLKEMGKGLGVKSISTIHQHLSALEEKGYIQRRKSITRSIEIKKTMGMTRIPILGFIAAGEPIEAVINKEFISVPKLKIGGENDVYALKVKGNSMIDENIRDGDIVLVRYQETAENGQRVVALIDNNEATLKKFYAEKNQIRLQPANKTYEPIIIKGDRNIQIQGIVVDVIQNIQNTYFEPIISPFCELKEKILPKNKIILGDALIELKKLPDESCDVVIVDPPYNIGKDFGNNIDKRELIDYVLWCKEWINECIRALKPTGTMFIYGFSEILAHLSIEIPINKRWLIWHYTNKNVASLNFWQRSHEAIICAWKDKPVFNRDEVREPYTEGFLNGAAGKVRKGTLGRFSSSGLETVYKAHERGALPRDVIKIPALAGGAGMIERWFLCKTCDDVYEPRQLKNHNGHEIMKHPTQKPFELSKKLIKSAMPKKDGVILVPFVGTGSECAAAKELGQSYIGFEINPDYVRLAEKMVGDKKLIAELF
ncbi:MAG: transcriptional repressor LexA [bacterium]|nr:transcriptional repressor LexA [bacterium]